MQETDIAVAIATISQKLDSHGEASRERGIEMVRRLDLINGTLGEHEILIAKAKEDVLVLHNRWVMLGWTVGTALLVASIAITTAGVFFR
jgi:hypothetical protein|tara:strand:+ start:197 stop:466 length:270 start_codon:yes stop_codon:yes gene_type:complete